MNGDTTVDLPRELVRRLREARSCGAITGAGMSAESGIRTYRGAGGIYDDPAVGDATVEALTGTTLARDPDRTWRAIADIVRQAMDASPNPAHVALADLETRLDRCVVLTQNVDGLHRRAGSRNVIEIHGNVFTTTCVGCGRSGRASRETIAVLSAAPRCTACGAVLRPDAVLFGEPLPQAAVERMLHEFYVNPPDAILVVGTSSLFPYITEPVAFARDAGRLTVEINTERTVLSDVVSYALRGRAGTVVPALTEVLGAGKPG